MTTNLLSVIEQQHKALQALHYDIGTINQQHGIAEAALAAGQQALEQARAHDEADELLENLGLDPRHFRTDGGFINHLKVKAAILHPEEYSAKQCKKCSGVGVIEAVFHQDESGTYSHPDDCPECGGEGEIVTHPQATELAPSMLPIGGWKVRVRGSNQELHCTGIYDNTVFVDLPAPSTAGEAFTKWLRREMPAGTVIGDPDWWAPRILRALLQSTAMPLGELTESACEVLSTVLHFIPASEPKLAQDVSALCHTLRTAARTQPVREPLTDAYDYPISGGVFYSVDGEKNPLTETERIKEFLHKHKSSALPDGACKTCQGECEIGGQFSGGIQECPDCAGSGKSAHNITKKV